MFLQNVGICLQSTWRSFPEDQHRSGMITIESYTRIWIKRLRIITKSLSHENLSPGRNSKLCPPEYKAKSLTAIFGVECALGLFSPSSSVIEYCRLLLLAGTDCACEYAYRLVTTKIPSSLHPVPLPSPQSNYTSYTRATGEIVPVYLITHSLPLHSSHTCTLYTSCRNSRPFLHDDHCLGKILHFNPLKRSGNYMYHLL
jgi:hypothetical protein